MWLDLSEDERVALVLQHHESDETSDDHLRMHAIVHSGIETQLAEGNPSTRAALERMLEAGLDRHEAVHAVGGVLASHIYHTLEGNPFDCKKYHRDLDGLSADTWKRTSEEH